MTGAQIGIITDESHTRARIRSIDTKALEAELDSGRIIVVAGFQGMSSEGQLTTLGRGGSDTTALAIAAALGVGGDSEVMFSPLLGRERLIDYAIWSMLKITFTRVSTDEFLKCILTCFKKRR